MAEITTFNAIHYDFSLPLKNILVPPYDVISENERIEFIKMDPRNFVQLLLGEGNNWHSKASELFLKWQDEGILKRDPEPSFYVSEERFRSFLTGKDISRRGFFAAVKVSSFSEKIIKPHEKTHPGPKEDRLKLLTAMKAHIDPVFSMFPESKTISSTLDDVTSGTPTIEFSDYAQRSHRLWRVSDQKRCETISNALKNSHLYIIDGHHRYETALTYSQQQRSPKSRYVLMFLISMDDPGLASLPIHRVLTPFTADMFENIKRLFEVTKTADPFPRDNINLVTKDGIFDLKVKGTRGSFYENIPVVLLHKIVFERLLGMDAAEQRQHITYVNGEKSATDAAVKRAMAGEIPALFMLPPVENDDVKGVADASLTFPQKSTFFVPKVLSGQVMYSID